MSWTDLLVMNVQITVIDALIYALIGFIFVFIGIGILIAVLYLVGFIMQKTKGKKFTFFEKINIFKLIKKKMQARKEQKEEVIEQTQLASTAEEELPNEIKAAIMAAIMSYYSVEKPKCEFVVKKIKRI